MQYYVATFIRYVGDAKYEPAYNLLSYGFKQNYFKTYEEFAAYAKEKYPLAITLKYGDLQREGELYILEVTVKENFSDEPPFTQTFIVKENDFNDYELAFSV